MNKKNYIDLMIAVLLSTIVLIAASPPTWESFMNTVADQLQNDGLRSLRFVLFLAAWSGAWVLIYLKKPKLLEILWMFVVITTVMSAEVIILMPWPLQLIISTIFLFLTIAQFRHTHSEYKKDTSTNKKESVSCVR